MSDYVEFARLSRDLRQATTTLERREARYLVDLYYQMQDYRIAASNQVRSMSDEPHATIAFFADQMQTFENQIKSVLDAWTTHDPLGAWAKSVVGIGPVIAAGLLAHIDMERAETAGQIWRYAGLDPTVTWEKGQKRPWNAALKVICWKAGESFVKVSGRENAFYGHTYVERKQFETERNELVRKVTPRATIDHPSDEEWYVTLNGEMVSAWPIGGVFYTGGNAEWAYKALKKNIGKDTDAYKSYSQGKLPPAHIHARAKRYAVKLFLSHFHEIGYEMHFGRKPPAPYPIAILGHKDYIAPSEAVPAR